MTSDLPDPPVAPVRPHQREFHGDVVTDDYAWLVDKTDPAVLEHLKAENAYADAVMAPMADLQQAIFDEIKARTQETDLSVPYRKGTWWYFSRTEEGRPYRIHCRRPDDGTGRAMVEDDNVEEVLLDENVLAKDHEYLSVGVAAVSPDGRRLAYSIDHEGDEAYVLHVKDLGTGEILADEIPNTSYSLAWSADSGSFFYTTLDATQRPWQVHHHVVGTDPTTDRLVFSDPDERFFVDVSLTRSERLVIIEAGSKLSSEAWLLDADDPTGEPRVVAAREQDHEYTVAHHGEHLYIVSNRGDAPNFAVWRAPLTDPGPASWVPVIPHRDDTRIEAVECFTGHLVVHLRHAAVTGIRIVDLATGDSHELATDEPVSVLGPGTNEEFDTAVYRFGYQSLVTPPTVYEEDLATGERRMLKRQPVLGGYDPSEYASERRWATADDGTEVPISLVWKPGARPAGPAPCVLYAYGAYEISIDPWFSVARLSMLDRGVVHAIAHPRGGGELGRRWYDEGKLLAKPNTFSDVVACARHLIAEGVTAPDRLALQGRSAGGLMAGAVVNLAPELFRVVSAEVPFVDALNTILDPSLPLTVTEWEEWGNPIESADVYRCMQSYTPYENVAPVRYPAILALAGLNDPRVGYHEPAKWVSRLRRTATSATDPDRPVVLRTELGAGHGGPSGRYEAWRDQARVMAFLLWYLTPRS
jgi:oligopeptidase B